MIDLVKLTLNAGDGGQGRVSFRREKYVPKGGPNGGVGGRGGSIIFRASAQQTTLQDLAHVKDISANAGQAGGKQLMSGHAGEDKVVEVPVGTVIWLSAENKTSRRRRLKYPAQWQMPKSDARFTRYFIEKEGEAAPAREPDQPVAVDTAEAQEAGATTSDQFGQPTLLLYEFTQDGQEITVAQGGFGGRGNDSFKSSTKTTPLEAEYGTFGERKVVYIELKLLADVGLVGFPNAGKSTLLSRLTNARPKIADYPFTTLEPHLGIMALGGGEEKQELVIADIPGLIEGAHEGKGLGLTFLRHVEHCRILLYVLALPDEVVLDDTVSAETKVQQLWDQYQTLVSELRSHSSAFLTKKHLLILNKVDLYDEVMIDVIQKQFSSEGEELQTISAYTGTGLPELKTKLQTMV